MDNDKRSYMSEILKQHEEFTLIGLTGRLGSGCTEVANILNTPFRKLNLPPITPGPNGLSNDEERDRQILYRFADLHWLPYDIIKVRTIITSFVFDNYDAFAKDMVTAYTKGKGILISGDNTNKEMYQTEKCICDIIADATKKLEAAYNKATESFDATAFRTMLGQMDGSLQQYITQLGETDKTPGQLKYKEWHEFYHNFYEELTNEKNTDLCERLEKELEKEIPTENETSKNEVAPTDKEAFTDKETTATEVASTGKEEEKDRFPALTKLFQFAYDYAEQADQIEDRVRILTLSDAALNLLSVSYASKWWEKCVPESLKKPKESEEEEQKQKTPEESEEEKKTPEESEEEKKRKEERKKEGKKLFDSIKDILAWTKDDKLNFEQYGFVHDLVPAFADAVRHFLQEQNDSYYTELYQKYGNSIRLSGSIAKKADQTETSEWKSHVTAIPRRINQFIKSLRHPFSRNFAKPTRIAIDSIKSILEANYLRDRYSAFYLVAVSTEENVRIGRLTDTKNLTAEQIKFMDWNEYPNVAFDLYQSWNGKGESQGDTAEEKFYRRVTGADKEITFFDTARHHAYKNGLYPFILQDVGTSIDHADIYISNNYYKNSDGRVYSSDGQNENTLKWEVVRNISLISHPGLVLPTNVERCMQIAFAAKVNSGCLSRQVGAVVTDAEYNILSVGWNDVPCGDITCSRKNLWNLEKGWDTKAYSDYELKNPDFKNRVEKCWDENLKNLGLNENADTSDVDRKLLGLPWQYCFKDLHSDKKDSMRSRAMHGEEKALAHVHDEAIGGCLFTTSSPCEMCSKNAKNHRIKKIYYIEPYPGISENQYTNSGSEENRAEHILFTGAIGRAYMQMYTPILPQKDILAFLGISPKPMPVK